MNITDINNREIPSTFLTFEQEFQLEKERQKEKDFDEMKQTFAIQFPSVDFNCLQKQTDKIMTNDSSLHYRHEETGKIYSWNYQKKEWRLQNMQDKLLAFLFD